MDDGVDYKVHTRVRFLLDFDGSGEFNRLLLPDVQQSFADHVQALYEQDDILSEYIDGPLNFNFDGRRVDLQYIFSCCDENEAEAESFSDYCVQGIKKKLEAFGCRLTQITCKAEEADITWYEKLEDAIFGPRDQSQQSGMELK